jgi:crotonobetainyl-CoA:carnitine CoA-transferase CaiB-like acyl-CoA transferase
VGRGGAPRDNPQLRARGFFQAVAHSLLGLHEHPGLPVRLTNAEPPIFARPAPTLGEHTDEILRELLELDDAALAQLHADGIIGTRPRGA